MGLTLTGNQTRDATPFLLKMSFNPDHYTLTGDFIAKGGQGVVRKVRLVEAINGLPEALAMKTILNDKSVDRVVREARLLSELRHRNVVQFYGSKVTDFNTHIYMDLCQGNLIDLKKVKAAFTDLEVATIWCQLSDGLAFLHAQQVVHRDIKPWNVLYNMTEDKIEVKLADLGLAKDFSESVLTFHTAVGLVNGTMAYQAPEILEKAKALEEVTLEDWMKADIYSLGLVMVFVKTGEHPGVEWSVTHSSICSHFPKMLNSDAQKRPTASDTLDFMSKLLKSRTKEDKILAILNDSDQDSDMQTFVRTLVSIEEHKASVTFKQRQTLLDILRQVEDPTGHTLDKPSYHTAMRMRHHIESEWNWAVGRNTDQDDFRMWRVEGEDYPY